MGTIAITGSASGMGAATTARLRDDGHRVIGVDLHDADVTADLSTPDGRQDAIDGVLAASDGVLDGLVPFAGLGPLPDRPGSIVVAVNYFGALAVLEGLRPALAAAPDGAAAVAISSNSTTVQPGVPAEVVDACLAGDEERAKALSEDHGGSLTAYPATKTALARWARRAAVSEDWIGAGINLNVVAPGMVSTAMTDEGLADPTLSPFLKDFPLPVARPGRPEELAALVAFLLGPDARFLVGSVLFADGGTDALLRPDAIPANWDL